jgi:hypothetical protein
MALMYGNVNILDLDSGFLDHGVVFNTTSYKMGWEELKLLIPPNNIGHLTDREFDIAYANYIFSNDYIFSEFFIILYNVYINKDVYILVNDEEWAINLDQSLFKLIQQRYGLNAIKVETEEDYIYAMNSISDFNHQYGIANLDQDKERFSYFIESYRLQFKHLPSKYLEGFVVKKDE